LPLFKVFFNLSNSYICYSPFHSISAPLNTHIEGLGNPAGCRGLFSAFPEGFFKEKIIAKSKRVCAPVY